MIHLYHSVDSSDKSVPQISAGQPLIPKNYIHKEYSDNIELYSIVGTTRLYNVVYGRKSSVCMVSNWSSMHRRTDARPQMCLEKVVATIRASAFPRNLIPSSDQIPCRCPGGNPHASSCDAPYHPRNPSTILFRRHPWARCGQRPADR